MEPYNQVGATGILSRSTKKLLLTFVTLISKREVFSPTIEVRNSLSTKVSKHTDMSAFIGARVLVRLKENYDLSK